MRTNPQSSDFRRAKLDREPFVAQRSADEVVVTDRHSSTGHGCPGRGGALQRLFAGCALVLVAACSKDIGSEPAGPQVIPTVGGQSGQEGSCVFDAVPELQFDVSDMRRATVGRHETMLRWNGSGHELGTSGVQAGLQRTIFEISARGEPEVTLRCGGSAFLDVDVHMQIPASGLNVTFEAVAQAWGHGEEVFISSTLDRALESTLRAHAKQLADDQYASPALTDPEQYYFDLYLFRGGAGGHLIARRENEFCGVAAWPETYCDSNRVVLEPELALGDFAPERAFDALRDLGEQTLIWSDGGTTRVRFEIESESGALCAGQYFPRSLDDTWDGTEVVVPARIRATTTDGALDAVVSGSVVLMLSAAHGWDGRVRLEADAFGTQAAFADAGATLPITADADRVLNLHLEASRGLDGDRALVSVSVIAGDGRLPDAGSVRRGGADNVLACSGAPQVEQNLQGVVGDQ